MHNTICNTLSIIYLIDLNLNLATYVLYYILMHIHKIHTAAVLNNLWLFMLNYCQYIIDNCMDLNFNEITV